MLKDMCGLFERVTLIEDPEPHDGPFNMAVDEALLAGCTEPILRIYRWERGWVSFGYFQRVAEVRQLFPDRLLVRRWTGGGMVEHGSDFTYTLVVPADHMLANLPPKARYARIHRCVASAMREVNLEASLAEKDQSGDVCFLAPARSDVIVRGVKVAGAGQRKTRDGLLHQGSIQQQALPGEFGTVLAKSLADSVVSETIPSQDLTTRVTSLRRNRYADMKWTEHL